MADPTGRRKIEYTILREMEESVIAQKKYRMYLASAGGDSPEFLSLKEIDAKRAKIYESLCGREHPNLASVYEVRRISGNQVSTGGSEACTGSESFDGNEACTDSESFDGNEACISSGSFAGNEAYDGSEASDDAPEYLAVMEYVPGISLADEIYEHGPLTPQIALLYAHQIADGLSFLHKMGLVHKDIKPDNIIITRGAKPDEKLVKIIDLGIAEVYDPQKTYATEFGGTRGYRAPEVNDYVATPRSDVFSLGCVMNFMLCGYDPSSSATPGSPSWRRSWRKPPLRKFPTVTPPSANSSKLSNMPSAST